MKLEIEVEILVEEMFSETRFKAVDAMFTFVAIDKNNKPMKMHLN